MEKLDRLVVTVGTSLFTSASWRCEGPFETVYDYGRWCGTLRDQPLARRQARLKTQRQIEDLLRDDEEKARPCFADPRAGQAMRFSAELSTLLLFMAREGHRDLAGFLTDGYAGVDLVCPSFPEDPAHVAARHLAGVLEDLGVSHVRLADVLTGGAIHDRVDHFRRHLDSLARDPRSRVDLAVSGGYKIYAMYAAAYASHLGERWRVLYVHEERVHELIVQHGEQLDIGKTRVPAAPRITDAPGI